MISTQSLGAAGVRLRWPFPLPAAGPLSAAFAAPGGVVHLRFMLHVARASRANFSACEARSSANSLRKVQIAGPSRRSTCHGWCGPTLASCAASRERKKEARGPFSYCDTLLKSAIVHS